MSRSIRVEETAEGFVAYSNGEGSSFSFFVGAFSVTMTEVGENYLFETNASHAPYILQLITTGLSDEIGSLPDNEDVEILKNHYAWEMGYQAQASGMVTAPDSLTSFILPFGKVGISWTAMASADNGPESTQAGLMENSESFLSPTNYVVCSTIRNGAEVIMYSVQGLGPLWSPESASRKVERVACSTFFAPT
ncbi:hypothetical protein ACWD8L_00350 [Streptomyces sp. NPDC005133]